MVSRDTLVSQAEEFGKTAWTFFVNRWRLTILVLLALVIWGVIGLVSLPKEADPEVVIPIAVVSTVYPGASPADMEKLVTDKIEERIDRVSDVKQITSASREGVSSITVEFEASADLETSIRKLKEEVDNVKTDLPEDATDPIVTEIRMDDQAIVTISLLGDLAPDDLQSYGEDLQSLLEQTPKVSKVNLYGIEEKQMQVFVNISAMEGYGLSIGQIVSQINANNSDMPIGSLVLDDYYYQASLKGQLTNTEDLLNLPIATINGQNLFLRDVAEVREYFAPATSEASVYLAEDGLEKRSVTLEIYKQAGGNVLDMVDETKVKIEQFKKDTLPPGVDVFVANDYSEFIRDDINTLGKSAVQTIIIIFIVLFIALGFREAFLTSLSVPLIFAIGFGTLFLIGETLNSLTLFALILSLGLIVDTSIVIMEGIHENIYEHKLSPKQAAYLAVKMYKSPLIASTLTTISVFVPMAMMTGIMGEYIKHLPITITAVLIASLFVAIFILPAIAVFFFTVFKQKKIRKPLLSYIVEPLSRWHQKILKKILPSRKRRWSWVVGMIGLMILAFSFIPIGLLKVEMFPSIDVDFIFVNITAPVGTTLEETAKITKEVEAYIREIDEVDNYITVLGSGGVSFGLGGGGSGGSNKSAITVNLVKSDDGREKKSYVISEELRNKIKSITSAEVEIQEASAGPPSGAPIEVRIYGENIEDANNTAKNIVTFLEDIDGAEEITTDIETGTGEFYFKLKREKLAYYGLSAGQVAGELRTAVFGNDSVKILKDGDETPIVVQLDFRNEDCLNDKAIQLVERRDKVTLCRSNPENITDIQNLMIASPKGMVMLGELADLELHSTVTSIRHQDRERIVRVQAYNREDVPIVDIVTQLQEKVAEIELPSGVRVAYGGEMEDITESYVSLGYAMIVGFLLIVFLLVLQFRSFKQPFIIMFILPLSLIGVFAGLALLGRNFSFPGFIGIVALLGVVVNDSIVLIDRINYHINTGREQIDAIITAAGERLQPIILTSVTTAMGVLPLAFANELWGDLAWAIVFGITSSTVLTLIMVPIFYTMMIRPKKLILPKAVES
ncbi:MAG: efflux RND transporter permease subunit [Patescibacteria group bacterium]|nr:efflux RND transporter permease subunit [Patescibacteria group bacterium]